MRMLRTSTWSTASRSVMSTAMSTSGFQQMAGRSSWSGSCSRVAMPMMRPTISNSFRCSCVAHALLGTHLSSVWPTLLTALGHGTSSGSFLDCSSAMISDTASRNTPPASMPASLTNCTLKGCWFWRSTDTGISMSCFASCTNSVSLSTSRLATPESSSTASWASAPAPSCFASARWRSRLTLVLRRLPYMSVSPLPVEHSMARFQMPILSWLNTTPRRRRKVYATLWSSPLLFQLMSGSKLATRALSRRSTANRRRRSSSLRCSSSGNRAISAVATISLGLMRRGEFVMALTRRWLRPARCMLAAALAPVALASPCFLSHSRDTRAQSWWSAFSPHDPCVFTA
mmetsp:Transcript_67739/g.137275  ORF Transcript_67739/g.137275 Transcript_67739/m.137275 type:complete len:344 (-) Transcript_67739:1060-2091(-)